LADKVAKHKIRQHGEIFFPSASGYAIARCGKISEMCHKQTAFVVVVVVVVLVAVVVVVVVVDASSWSAMPLLKMTAYIT